MDQPGTVGWEHLEQVVAPRVLLDAFETSGRLLALGIPHALVGGLAIGHYGYPRATKDVDFLVGKEAFATTAPLLTFRDELSAVVQLGAIDLLAALPDEPLLEAALRLPAPGEIPIAPIEVLVLMKLRAGRAQDDADLEQLIRVGLDLATLDTWLQTHAPTHLNHFRALAQRARTRPS